VKVNHPTIPGSSKNVPDSLVEKYLSNGWTPAEEPKPKPAKKAAAKSPAKK
jgi:hypothetical protein